MEKISFSLDKIDLSLLDKNVNSIIDKGIDMNDDKMSDEDYIKLTDEQYSEILYKVREILDMFENFATLYNMNVLNNYFAYESYSENTIFIYSKFKRIIDFYRDRYDPFYYKNLEKCANKFIEIRQNEQKLFNKRIKEFEKLKQKATNRLEKLQNNMKIKSNIIKDKF
jgi:transcriptional regulator of heat shock response